MNVLEFKGINDPLTVADYNRNIGLITDPDVLEPVQNLLYVLKSKNILK